MSAADRAALQALGVAGPELSAPAPQCPYQRPAVRDVHQSGTSLPVAVAVYASIVSHPTGMAQTQSKWRQSRERSRQKRGPPIDLLS